MAKYTHLSTKPLRSPTAEALGRRKNYKIGKLQLLEGENWKTYSFKLKSNTLYFGDDPDHPNRSVQLFHSVTPTNSKGKPNAFELVSSTQTLLLAAEFLEDQLKWIDALKPLCSQE